MSEVSPVDDRGRFTVDPKWRKYLGRRVYQIRMPEGILLVPAEGLTSAEKRRLRGVGDDAEAAARDEAG